MKQAADLADKIFDGLLNNGLNTVGALIIFLLALPLIRMGLREKPTPPAVPADQKASPIEIESAWLVQNVTRMQMDIDNIKGLLGVLSNQVAGVAQLIKRQGKAAAAARRAEAEQRGKAKTD